ncbi:helix-turn-helix domain-containing protein [Sinorhizobium medicae]
MGSAISLRTDFDGARLRLLARQAKDANQARRLLALASIYDGGSRSDAARLGSVTLQIVRDWVVRFNARGPDGLINGKAPGKSSLLNDTQRAALAQAIERGPTPYLDGVVRWRLCDLGQWLWEEFRVSVSEQTLGRELRSMGYRKLSARPRHHAQEADAAETFKKNFPAAVVELGAGDLRVSQVLQGSFLPQPVLSTASRSPLHFLLRNHLLGDDGDRTLQIRRRIDRQ